MPEAASLSGRIENGEHVFPTRVYYDYTDADGVVYYANFLRPARLDDVLDIHSRLLRIGGASMNMEQIIRRTGEDLVRMTLRIACVNRAGAAARLPNRLQSVLQKFLTEQGAINMRQS